ncbi:MAG: nitrate reductase subunit alpha [Burkholderiaceae bacterium]|nr:nitrate reductase subunit alpha [Burkholderiaceae bacterium]
MSRFLDRLTYFAQPHAKFSGGHGLVTGEDRTWEDAYRNRWAQDRIVRSTHGTNCTGSCSWKIYVKGGIVTWETQQTDYPRTRPDLPNHEPRGCARGASYSWYLYSAQRLKYPMVRGRLMRAWHAARERERDPVRAWASIVENEATRRDYVSQRGLGGFVRASWDEVEEIVAAANVYTIGKYGPDRIAGFSPIPAMSMISYASGARYLSLIGGTNLSFYDWYCDLPPSSPQVWGEQTDVPESADWYNSMFLIAWGSNVPQTRTPDAHFFVEARYKGTKIVSITPDYSEVARHADLWLHPKQGTDAALGMAMGHVILKEFYVDRRAAYFEDYARRYTDSPMLVELQPMKTAEEAAPAASGAGAPGAASAPPAAFVPGRTLRASDFPDALGQTNNPDWKTVAFDGNGNVVVPQGSIGFRWGPKDRDDRGKWNLENREAREGREVRLTLSLLDDGAHPHETATVAFPYFGGDPHPHFPRSEQGGDVLLRRVPVRRLTLADGREALVATVFDLLVAHYGVRRPGIDDPAVAADYDANVPYTPAWQEAITGVPRDRAIVVAREFAANAEKTQGRSMIIIGAGVNHWFHCDMNYRSAISMLVLCGCVGQSGGGWAHYVGQEKVRPQSGWAALTFALDWVRPSRQVGGTSFFYAHSDQWRYEKIGPQELLSPLADPARHAGAVIDYNVRAERMGWLPSAPQLATNPLRLARDAQAAGLSAADYVARSLKDGSLRMSCEDPDDPVNWPRNLFVWRSNLLGSSGKGHEYFLRHLLGTKNGVLGDELAPGDPRPVEVDWRERAPQGKLDLLVTLDFRMSTTCLHSDVVLPTASWYEKNDLNTTDMHPFIHPLSTAVDPVWQSRSDWEIYKGIARRFSELCEGHLGVEQDVVLRPLMHDSPTELGQALDVREWKRGECDFVPGVTAPHIDVVERDYPNTHRRYISLGPLMSRLGNFSKGLQWPTGDEVELLRQVNGTVRHGPTAGLAKIETDIDACETVMTLAPETNGHVAIKAWEALSEVTGRDHVHLALHRGDERIRFRDIQAQPRKIISSPTWSGLESDKVSYNAGYTNVHELIPWRTLTGRQQLYLDHAWMRDFGEGFVTYRPPVDLKSLAAVAGKRPNGHPEIALNFITPHQKWGIHSTYTENLIMLTLSRGGPIVWVSEIDAQRAGIVDNDWIELFNANGALTARAVVSQRVQQGMVLMYHAQEKIVNTPGSEITGLRGGIHNSVTRVVMKPTHMIGGYAQFAYGFNYYGTVGSNRDQFVLLRKMDAIDWIDEPAGAQRAAGVAEPAPGDARGPVRARAVAQEARR